MRRDAVDHAWHQPPIGASIGLVDPGSQPAMSPRPARRTILLRAIVLATTATLAASGLAFADSLRSDGDAITAGAQATIDIGEVAAGATVTVPVGFELTCAGTAHPDAGQSIDLVKTVASAPAGGSVLSVTSATLGPIPADWPVDGATCPDPVPVTVGGSSAVTVRAPTVPNAYTYTIGYGRTLSPAGVDDTRALSGTATSFVLKLTVVSNMRPALNLPPDRTVEADTVGGWASDWVVSATDAEDDPDPTPICSPAAGEVLPLGATTVACSVTDSGGRSTSGSFRVTVVDTTAPGLVTDTDHEIVATDPGGAPLAYAPASATDVVDPAPTVGCAPAAGSTAAVGATVVTCTATDASGNSTSAGFTVTVTYDPPPTPTPAPPTPTPAPPTPTPAPPTPTPPPPALPPPPTPTPPPAPTATPPTTREVPPGKATGHGKDVRGHGHAWGHHKEWPGKGHPKGHGWWSLRHRPR